ncbi:MAG: LysO family transporter [Pyrobaculum sp.]
MGWYSFTSPFLANIAGDEEGVYGLLVNLLREQLTYITAPFLTKRFGKVGVLAVGGATTMDNTCLHSSLRAFICLLVPLVYYATSV